MDTLLSNCKEASKELLKLSNEDRNKLLFLISNALKNEKNINEVLKANEIDVNNANQNGISKVMVDRLSLNKEKIIKIADSIIDVMKLPNYIGEIIENWKTPTGLNIKKVRVPFGVIATVFESRPNVAVDISVLTLKTANACVLKGGKEAINTNKALVKIMKDAIKDIVNPNVITLIETTDRSATDELIRKKEYIDLLIPRGSKRLINYIVENAKVPYIETGAGNCSLYIHKDADLDKAIKVAINAKIQRPSVCNAIENIVIDEEIEDKFLPLLEKAFNGDNMFGKVIEIRADEKALRYINGKLVDNEDYDTEYNDYIIAIKTVKDISEAISFINAHSTKHSEAIITENIDAKNRFENEIDSACVYHNASTRFTDGGEFGFGAEIGISTTKLQARGPMGLKEITTYKYIIEGKDGECRK